jgi:fructose-bisphosphate aldolase class II
MAIHYKDLGLVNTKVVFQMAMEGGYAVPAYNFNNMEQLQAVIAGCVETDSPVILQHGNGRCANDEGDGGGYPHRRTLGSRRRL